MPSTTRKLHLVEQAASNGEKRAVLVALREPLAVRIDGDNVRSRELPGVVNQFLAIDAEIRRLDEQDGIC
jgi:hypothetical protein